MNLLIDDTRDIGTEVIARTAEAAEELLYACDYQGVLRNAFDVVFFDNDLGSGQKEGYQILEKYLYGMQFNSPLPKIGLVTSNPVARGRMEATLKNFGFVQDISTQLWEKQS